VGRNFNSFNGKSAFTMDHLLIAYAVTSGLTGVAVSLAIGADRSVLQRANAVVLCDALAVLNQVIGDGMLALCGTPVREGLAEDTDRVVLKGADTRGLSHRQFAAFALLDIGIVKIGELTLGCALVCKGLAEDAYGAVLIGADARTFNDR